MEVVFADHCGELLSRDAVARGLWLSLLGRRFVLPQPVAVALERVFGEPVGRVIIIERSRYARAHWGMCATTRPNRIFLPIAGMQVSTNSAFLLNAYFHFHR